MKSIEEIGGLMQKSNLLFRLFQAMVCSLVLSAFLPITAQGQRRWVVVRPARSRVVVYNYRPRPYVVYQRRPYYSYQNYTYSYPQPYYTNQYYSYRDTQPYFANRYTYSWANPTYYYNDYSYRPRHRHNRFRVGIWLR